MLVLDCSVISFGEKILSIDSCFLKIAKCLAMAISVSRTKSEIMVSSHARAFEINYKLI